MKVAYVHDWLVSYRGGEKVLEALLTLHPNAPIYSLFYDPGSMPPAITSRTVITPKMLNSIRKLRKALLPILPNAIESFDFSKFDLIISTSSCVAKGAKAGPNSRHICYLHSPMRYIWDQQDEYIEGVKHIPFARQAIKAMTPRLRRWDIESAKRVDQFVVNSTFVGERVKNFYDRDSIVVHPPVDVDRFTPTTKIQKDDYYLAAGALVSYKRFDLAVDACEKAGVPLVIAGSGPFEKALRQQAGPNVRFEISPSDERLVELMQKARGLLFPGVEDFGIIAIEAMAAGTPVIAYKKGGALDFVNAQTGLLFERPEELIEILANQAAGGLPAEPIMHFASSFRLESFLDKFNQALNKDI